MAKKIFNKIGTSLDWKEFAIGTTFPDIRQLANTERSLLHKPIPTLGEVATQNSFMSGIFAHSYVDLKREEFLERESVYKLIEKNPVNVVALKLVEDQIMYKSENDWSSVAAIYDQILPQETKHIPKDVVKKWHQGLKYYFSKEPEDEVFRKLINYYTVYSNFTEEIIKSISLIRQNNKIIEIIKDTYNIY